MASDAPPKSPAAPGSSDTPMTDSPPKYVPQFSAATEMILKRIQSGSLAGSSSLSSIGMTGTPPGYEDMKRNVMMGMKTSMNMEIPTPPIGNRQRAGAQGRATASNSTPRAAATPTSSAGGSGSGKGRGAGRGRGGARAGTKRKRMKSESLSEEEEESDDAMSKLGGDSDSDDVESVTELPKITQSGRQVVKPAPFVPTISETNTRKRAPSKRSQEQALCKRCQRGHSPQKNMIVFCDGCNMGWHQMCHDPIVSEEMVNDESAPWFCLECSNKKGIKSSSGSEKSVSWQGKSAEEKRSYFNSLPHQQLVNLLMQATVLHPNLPIFPHLPTSNASNQTHAPQRAGSERRTTVHPQQPFPPPATSGLFARAEATPNAPMNFIRKIQPGQTTPGSTVSPSQANFAQSSSAPPTLNVQGEDSRESTPASPPYPKPGNGLMAKLPADEEDIEWLVDNNDFEPFSHIVYDANGEKTEENGVPVNGGQQASA